MEELSLSARVSLARLLSIRLPSCLTVIGCKVSVLVAVTTLLRGPLMQRASLVQAEVFSVPCNIDLEMNYNVTAD